MNPIKLLARTLFTVSLLSAGIVHAALTVSITSPANNATFVAPASITINANAAAAGSTVSKVDFYNGATKIGTDTTSPYSFAWTNVAVGTYTVTAKATDALGAVTTSAAITVKVNANVAPSVSITAPVTNAAFAAPAAITINANAADTDGTIAKVDFYNGTTLLGTDTTSPYSFAWANVAVGTYTITAKATDDKGAVTTSTAITVKVNANVAPTVSITTPVNNAAFVAPASITINANAADTDGTISKVDFYNGTTLLGTDTISPYSYGWTNVAAGTYSITAKATDDKGAVTTSAAVSVKVNANQTPTVSVAAPANNATFTAPAAINITANAADADGTITKVDFYNGTTLLGTDTTSPYSYSWASVAAGTYSITAKATDNLGAVTTSSAVSVTVAAAVANKPPTVSISTPANNATFTAPATIAISATAADTDGTIAKVEFYNSTTLLNTDTTSPYSYSWTNVAAGTYSITAKATDNLGAVTTSAAVSITVGSNQAPTVSLTAPANNAAFAAPAASIIITANAADADGTIAKVEFFNGTALLGTDTTSPYSYNWTNVAAGTYSVTAKATDNNGASTTSAATTITVAANQPPIIDFNEPVVDPNTTIYGPLDILLGAIASDPDGTVTKVEFFVDVTFRGPVKIGEATNAPYRFLWKNVYGAEYGTKVDGTSNTYSFFLRAVATDNAGATTAASKYLTIVTSPDLPVISFYMQDSPFIDKAVYATTQNLIAGVYAYFPKGGKPQRVQIYANTTLLCESTNVVDFSGRRFYCDGSTLPAGTYTINAKITSATGVVAAKTAGTIYVQTAPTIRADIATPADGDKFWPGHLDIAGSFTLPTGGTFKLYRNNSDCSGSSAANDVVMPTAISGLSFSATYNWDPALPYTQPACIRAYALAPDGTSAQTIKIIKYLTPGVTFVNKPITVYAPTVDFEVSAAIPPSTPRVEINGVVATFNGNTYKANLPLTVGSNTITAIAYNGVTEVARTSFDTNYVASDARTLTAGITRPQYTNSSNATANFVTALTTANVYGTVTGVAATTVLIRDAQGSTRIAQILSDGTYNESITAYSGYNEVIVTAYGPGGALATTTTSFMNYTADNTPVIVVTSPKSCTVVSTVPATISVVAAAFTQDQTNQSPNYYTATFKANGVYVGSVNKGVKSFDNNMNFTWTGVQNGAYQLTASLDNNAATTSTPIKVTVSGAVIPPTLLLTAPVNNITVGSPVTLTVNAQNIVGTIATVEFFDGPNRLIGYSVNAASSNYTLNYVWEGATLGSHSLTVRVTNSAGIALTSAPITITVSAAPIQVGTPNTPLVKLIAPANNSTVGTPVTLTVNAQNIAGTIATIEFLDGANQIIGYNINAASSNYTLNYVWTNPTSGSHTLTAKVKNSAGVVFTSAPVTVQISAAPTINLSAAGSFYLAPANVDLVIGTTVSAVGATLSRVEIYSSVVTGGSSGTTTLVTTLTAPPYRYHLTNLAVGTYNITVRAVDSLGNSSDSAPLEIRVGTAYGIVLPATLNGSTINGNTLSFIATINALANSSVTVNGVNATVSRDGRIVVNGLALTAGVNTITITVTPPTGAVLTQTFTVTRATTPPSFEMMVSPIQGTAPLLSLVEVKNPGNTPFATELLSCNNPTGNVALAENQSTTLAGALECRYTKPGVYKPWAAIKDASGAVIWSSTKYVVVSGPLDSYQIVRNVYSNMVEQLKAGNATGALGSLSGDAKTKYGNIFTALGTNLATVAAQLGDVVTTTISADTAEIILIRNLNGVKQTFSIHLLLGEDGVWRIESM
jgi:predicted phage tail protein